MSPVPIRHNRRDQFDDAVAAGPRLRATASHWSELSPEPSDPRCVAHRAETLRAAWRDPVDDRVAFLRDRCVGARVLDLGCVAHDAGRAESATWLHRQLAEVSRSCVGVDVLPEGVESLEAQGFDAVCHDFSLGLGPFEGVEPFEVIVAGELIEHLGNPQMLFDTAKRLLADDGVLILTSPNPYAPQRVRAGLRGIAHENCDHVTYAFPAGVAEFADRAALRLAEVRTTTDRIHRSAPVRRLKRWVRASGWRAVGITTVGPRRAVALRGMGPLAAIADRRFAGETAIYVIARAASEAANHGT